MIARRQGLDVGDDAASPEERQNQGLLQHSLAPVQHRLLGGPEQFSVPLRVPAEE